MEGTETLRIYEALQKLQDYLDDNTTTTLSGTKKVSRLDAEELDALINDIEMVIPEDIRRANSIFLDRDRILGDARDQADSIVKAANTRVESLWKSAQESSNELIAHAKSEQARLVSQHEITKAAEKQAKAIKAETIDRCNKFYTSIQEEAHQLLDEVARTIAVSAEQLEASRNTAFEQLKNTITDLNNSTRSVIVTMNKVNDDIESQREWIDGREPRTRQQYDTPAPEYPEYSEQESEDEQTDYRVEVEEDAPRQERKSYRPAAKTERTERASSQPTDEDEDEDSTDKKKSGLFGKVIDFFTFNDEEDGFDDSSDI